MAQIEGVYFHVKQGTTVYDCKVYDSPSDVGDNYWEVRYQGNPAYIALADDKTGKAYQTYGTPLAIKKSGVELWVLTEPLLTATLTIVAEPSDAVVTINGVVTDSVTVNVGESVEWSVSCDGYITQSGTWTATADETITVELVEKYLNCHDIQIPVEGGSGWYFMDYIDTNAESWEADYLNSDWLYSYEDGLGLEINLNTSIESRTGQIKITATFSDGSTMVGYINVTQAGVEAVVENYLNLSAESLNFPADGGSQEITVDTNADSFTFMASMVSREIIELAVSNFTCSVSGNKITVTAATNTSTSARTGTLTVVGTFSDGSTITKTVDLSQEAGGGSGIIVDPGTVSGDINIDFDASGGTKTVITDLASITSFIVSYDGSGTTKWLTVSYSGSDLNVTADANTSSLPRSATAVVSGIDSGGSTATVTVNVNQSGYSSFDG